MVRLLRAETMMIGSNGCQPVELAKSYRLLNHGPTVLVTSAHDDARNVMAASWQSPLNFDPPQLSLVIDKTTYTRELVDRSGEFALSVPLRPLAAAVELVGNESGRNTDKFGLAGLSCFVAD